MPGSGRFAWLLPPAVAGTVIASTVIVGSVITGSVVAGTASAAAQDRSQALLGMRLFDQSCRVCHTRPQLASPRYGPALSRNTLGGNVDLIGAFISSGSTRMPGFQYQFTPAQIAAIAAYIATLPVPAPASSGGGKAAAGGDAD